MAIKNFLKRNNYSFLISNIAIYNYSDYKYNINLDFLIKFKN